MPLTPETLTRHELVGLPVRVADAASDAHVGIAGRVVSESQHTLTVRETPTASRRGGEAAGASGDKVVPKEGATFEFALPSAHDSVSQGGPEAGTSQPTDEAAGTRKRPGSAPELPPLRADILAVGDEHHDTAGLTAGQSGGCEDAVYVTVDGARLLSRPAFRTERAGDSTWQ